MPIFERILTSQLDAKPRDQYRKNRKRLKKEIKKGMNFSPSGVIKKPMAEAGKKAALNGLLKEAHRKKMRAEENTYRKKVDADAYKAKHGLDVQKVKSRKKAFRKKKRLQKKRVSKFYPVNRAMNKRRVIR